MMDLKEMAENIGLEEEEYLEMLELFFETGIADLEKLETAIKELNAQEAHKASHSLKGSSGSLGLQGIYEKAKAIDDKNRNGDLEGVDEMVKDLRKEYESLIAIVGNH